MGFTHYIEGGKRELLGALKAVVDHKPTCSRLMDEVRKNTMLTGQGHTMTHMFVGRVLAPKIRAHLLAMRVARKLEK